MSLLNMIHLALPIFCKWCKKQKGILFSNVSKGVSGVNFFCWTWKKKQCQINSKIISILDPNTMEHICNPFTWEGKTEELWVQSQPELQSKFEANHCKPMWPQFEQWRLLNISESWPTFSPGWVGQTAKRQQGFLLFARRDSLNGRVEHWLAQEEECRPVRRGWYCYKILPYS